MLKSHLEASALKVEKYLDEELAPRGITVSELKSYAKRNNLPLKGLRRKQEMWDFIRRNLQESQELIMEEIESPGIGDLNNNTNILDFKSKDLLVFGSEDCRGWLLDVLKSKKLFSGLEGDIYAYGDSLMKSEFFAENVIYSVIFMKKLNEFKGKGFPHFVETYAVYKCQSPKNSSEKLITFMEKLTGPNLSQVNLSEKELQSVFVQCLMIFVLFMYAGMNHFDLHKDNIILEKIRYRALEYSFGDSTITIPSYGILVKIIDFGNVGFLLSDKVLLSSPNPLGDYRKAPWYFNQGAIEVFVSSFPPLRGKEEIFKAWKRSNVDLYRNNNIQLYKRNTAIDLFHKIETFFEFSAPKSNVLRISLL